MKAFPHIAKVHMVDGNSIIKEEITSGGMDLRDYFAAKAMQGLLSTTKEETWIPNDVAEISYLVADALIKAREEK